MSWPWDECVCGHIRDAHLYTSHEPESCQSVIGKYDSGTVITCPCKDFEAMQAFLV